MFPVVVAPPLVYFVASAGHALRPLQRAARPFAAARRSRQLAGLRLPGHRRRHRSRVDHRRRPTNRCCAAGSPISGSCVDASSQVAAQLLRQRERQPLLGVADLFAGRRSRARPASRTTSCTRISGTDAPRRQPDRGHAVEPRLVDARRRSRPGAPPGRRPPARPRPCAPSSRSSPSRPPGTTRPAGAIVFTAACRFCVA